MNRFLGEIKQGIGFRKTLSNPGPRCRPRNPVKRQLVAFSSLLFDYTIIGLAFGNVSIRVRDVNDNSPVFERSDYFVTVPETVPIHTPVMTLLAKDEDNEAKLEFVFILLDWRLESTLMN